MYFRWEKKSLLKKGFSKSRKPGVSKLVVIKTAKVSDELSLLELHYGEHWYEDSILRFYRAPSF